MSARTKAITALVGTMGDRDHGGAMVDAIERAGVQLVEAIPDDGGPVHATMVDGTVLRDRTAGSLGIAGGRS